jgi:hypothetical protein
MGSYSMGDQRSVRPLGFRLERTIPGGFFAEVELMAFSLLIHHRRSLPVYLGNCWRCYLCDFESEELIDIVEHLLQDHDPERTEEASHLELEVWDRLVP